jgi:dihydropteroate synthase
LGENYLFQAKSKSFDLGQRTWLMAVVNVTPDSFYDGGVYFEPARAVERGLELAADGADIIDIGGESTRPGSNPVPAEEEKRRVLPQYQ